METIDYSRIPGKVAVSLKKTKKLTPLIRIITIYDSYNDNLIETVNSVINQTLENWEWIIININNSNNNIKEQLRKIEELKIDRIKICKSDNLEKIENHYQTDNNSYHYICFLPVGTLLDETFLECAYWTLITNLDYNCTYSNYIVYGDDEYTVSSLRDKKNIYANICFIMKKELFSEIKVNIKNNDNLLINLLSRGCKPIKMNFYGFWCKKIKDNSDKAFQSIDIKDFLKLEKKYPYSCNYYYRLPKVLNYNKEIIDKNSSKIKLLFLFPWFRMGGADKFNYNLISKLDKEKYDITIITTEDCEYQWRQEFEKYATIFDLTTFLNREDWASFIYYIIETRDINIVMVSNSYYAYYAVPWLKSKFPKVVFVDYLHAVNEDWRNGEYPADSVSISNILDKTYVSSQYIKDYMINEKNRTNNNVKVIYAGVDTDIFNEENVDLNKYPEISKYKEKYLDKKIILFCARLEKEKRPIFMLQIFRQLLLKYKDVLLFVVGTGELLNVMEKFVYDNNLENNVVFCGEKKDVTPYYKLSDILVVCSEREGITLTTYEALSMGVPVVSADVGGQYELVNDSCGKLIKYNNIDDELDKYVEAIYNIINSESYIEIKKNCKKQISEKFSVNLMIKEFDKEFDYFIKNGSQVPIDTINNEQLYARYLLLYNELDRRYFEEKEYDDETVTQNNDNINKEIEEKNLLIEEKQKIIEEKQKIIDKKDYELYKIKKEIDEYKKTLQKIYNSKSWKLSNRITRIIHKFK